MKLAYFKTTTALLLLLTFIVPQTLFAQDPFFFSPPEASSVVSSAERELNLAIMAAETSLKQTPTHLEYTKYMMLKNKKEYEFGSADDTYSSYYLKPRGASPLSREYSGIPVTTSGIAYNSGLGSEIDIMTGGRAIDESLQLGSVGLTAVNRATRQQQADYSSISSALRSYYYNNGEYPNELQGLLSDKFTSEYLDVDFTAFSYVKTTDYYELEYLFNQSGPFSIEEVEGLTIEHHPWDEMIGSANPEVPDVYRLIPDDYFFIHFNDLEHYRELEETLAEVKGPLAQVYGIGDSLSAQKRIFDRLGIDEDVELEVVADEAVLVSYDFDGYPATDYALILKMKPSELSDFTSNSVTADKDKVGESGEYYIVATSDRLLRQIQALGRRGDAGMEDASNAKRALVQAIDGGGSSMADALDLKYSLSVLEEERDGFVFISDAFVEKVTSPEYRINARRRNSVLVALETLQYSTLAYKDITGDWPESIGAMVDEGYVSSGSIYEEDKYSIDREGVVWHEDWGSIYKVTPISQVEIRKVTFSEKVLYERFREGYQELWREFIDPVAISILVGDQIRFHTIILPLIDSSEYNWIKDVVGSENDPLDFMTSPDRIPALQMTSHLDVDSILYSLYRSSPRDFDEVYSDCVQEHRYSASRSGRALSEMCPVADLSEDVAILGVKKLIAETIGWEGVEADLFSFMGDEAMVAVSEDTSFLIDDMTNFDVYLGVEFSNPEEGKVFIEHLLDWVSEELFGGGNLSAGIFGISPGQPIKNVYNGAEYYMVPTGFVNLFYIFIDDRVYFAISQKTINALIDGRKGVEWPEHMERLKDYLGSEQNISMVLDGQKLNKWLVSFAKDQMLSYMMSANLEDMQAYTKEASLLNKFVESGSDDFEFYSFIPDEWMGLPVELRNGRTYISVAGDWIDVHNVGSYRDFGYSSYFDRNGDNSDKIKFEDFIENVDTDKLLQSLVVVDTLGANLSITENGLDIQIAFNNSARDAYDGRVLGQTSKLSVDMDGKEIILIIVALALILLLLLMLVLVVRQKKGLGDLSAQVMPAENYPPPVTESED